MMNETHRTRYALSFDGVVVVVVIYNIDYIE